MESPEPYMHLIAELGVNPLTTRSFKSFKNFFKRANARAPQETAELIDNIITFHEFKRLRLRNVCQVIGIEVVKDTAYCKADPFIDYLVPNLTYFHRARSGLLSANLPMHCSTYGFFAKLGLDAVYQMTEIRPTHNQNNAHVKWCSSKRTWTWTPTNRRTCEMIEDCPFSAFRAMRFPRSLAANFHGSLPLQCYRCQIWTKDSDQMASHQCYRPQAQHPDSACNDPQRIDITYELDNITLTTKMQLILCCGNCMMFFTKTDCYQSHLQFCRQSRCSRFRISPSKSLLPLHNQPRSLLIEGSPFRKLRCGCSHCLRSFYGADHLVTKYKRTLKWTYIILSLLLRNFSRTRSLLHVREGTKTRRISLTKNKNIRNEILTLL